MTFRSKKLPVVLQSAGASEKGKEDRVITKTKVWERLSLFDVLLLFFFNNNGFKPISSTIICV